VIPDRGSRSSALRIYLWSRGAIALVAAATVVLLSERANPARARWDTARLHELGVAADVWARWDSDWFLRIAQDGYSWPSGTPAFFPLYPLLTGGLGWLLAGHELLAGIALSLVAGGVAFALLHRLGMIVVGSAAASRAVVLLAVFPTSLFLGAVYSEALFLALAVGVFLLAERGRLGWACLVAGVALLTRVQGLALLPALAVFAWRRPQRRDLALVLTPLAVFATYPLLLAAWIGHPFAFLDAQRTTWERAPSALGPLGGIVEAARGASFVDADLVALAFVIVMVPLAALAWRRLGTPYGVYALLVMALPMSFPSERLGGLYSFPRLCLVAFPCFLAAGTLSLPRAARVAVVAVLATALTVNVVRWSLWYWVA
jgi:hypothetical protein